MFQHILILRRFKLPSFLTDEEKQPLLEFTEAEVIDNTLIMVKKESEDLKEETDPQTNSPKKKL